MNLSDIRNENMDIIIESIGTEELKRGLTNYINKACSQMCDDCIVTKINKAVSSRDCNRIKMNIIKNHNEIVRTSRDIVDLCELMLKYLDVVENFIKL